MVVRQEYNFVLGHITTYPKTKLLYGTPSLIRTGDTQVRSLMLYPAELWVPVITYV